MTRIRLAGGPHNGQTVTYCVRPAVLVMLDADFCYHEYVRDRRSGLYRWRRGIGRPTWAPPSIRKALP